MLAGQHRALLTMLAFRGIAAPSLRHIIMLEDALGVITIRSGLWSTSLVPSLTPSPSRKDPEHHETQVRLTAFPAITRRALKCSLTAPPPRIANAIFQQRRIGHDPLRRRVDSGT